MRERNDLILADLIANRADAAPDFPVATFDGGGARPDEVRTYADLLDERQPHRRRADRPTACSRASASA